MFPSSHQLKLFLRETIRDKVVRHLPSKYQLDIYNASARISPKFNYIYIHIPRTGGTSIARILGKLNSSHKEKVTSRNYFWSGKIRLYKHAQASEIKAWFNEDVWQDFFSFAIVRNPWDLTVSLYHYWLQLAVDRRSYFKESLSDDVEAVKKMGNFTSFVKSDYGDLLIVKKGEIFDWISENNQIIVDFVGKFENIENDWNYICKCINIETIPLPKTNHSYHKSYQQYYTEETRQIVAKRFKKTIETFGYTF